MNPKNSGTEIKTVETVQFSEPTQNPRLKPGVNEKLLGLVLVSVLQS